MRAAVAALFAGLCTPAPAAPVPRDLAPDRARDLKLTAKAESPTVEPGRYPRVTLTLENSSKAHSYFVVKSGDGSEVGWREPYVYFTAEAMENGKWAALPRQGLARCGLYANEWWKDVVELKPGEKLVVAKYAHTTFPMPAGGRLRLTGHYDYRGGVNKGGGRQPVADRGAMGDAPPFALTSNAVEVEVVKP